ncbi:Hypothetical predicted protein [Xyrichtys novacula]|uniref:Uncharacterized protein n=1 Tax=Xyrichtys novacula TaxID=13765 RepID=A0AAV1HLI1_XYRNO|nr:Hypothetical predicted protein [Xyrichtys novacula]
MDDRAPNGRGTADPSSASKRDPALQSRVLRRRCLPVLPTRNLPVKMSLFLD